MPVSDVALVVIAVAVTVQTAMIAAGFIAGMRAWRRLETDIRQWQASLDHRFDAVSSRIDEVVVDARLAARSVENLATRAGGLMHDAATAAHTVRTAVTAPKALLLTGAASAARWLLGKRRSRYPRSSDHINNAPGADIF
jgi:ABC-type siderophore export system fused ATPase/permease subunit